MAQDRTCSGCDHWDEKGAKALERRQCRRYPPVLVPDPQKTGKEVRPWWPETYPEQWCGEFKHRGEWDE